jgi:tetratricopeptide (TPR) repeat protein
MALAKRASPEIRAGWLRRALAAVGTDPSPLAVRIEALATLAVAGTLPLEEQIVAEEEALAFVRRTGDEELVGQALGALGLSLRSRGRTQRARELLEEALVIHRRHGDRRHEAFALGNLANTLRYEDPRAAIAYCERSAEVHRQNGSLLGVAMSLGNVAGFLMELNDAEGARRACQEALDQVIVVGATDTESLFRSNLAVILLELGREAEAERHLDRALELAVLLGDPVRIAGASFQLTSLSSRRGADALRLLEQAESGFAGLPDHLLSAVARKGVVLHALGRESEARAALARAEALVADLPPHYPDHGEALEELALLRRAFGIRLVEAG